MWSFKASELIAEYPALKRWHAHIYALLLKSFPGTAYGKAFPAGAYTRPTFRPNVSTFCGTCCVHDFPPVY